MRDDGKLRLHCRDCKQKLEKPQTDFETNAFLLENAKILEKLSRVEELSELSWNTL